MNMDKEVIYWIAQSCIENLFGRAQAEKLFPIVFRQDGGEQWWFFFWVKGKFIH